MISIIIPVLNEAEHIAQTLTAVHQAAGATPYEVIVVDGGSTDDTVKVIEQLAEKVDGTLPVQVVMSQKGRARQMNVGAVQASGDWLLFLHADTLLEKGALDAIAKTKTAWGRFDVRLSASTLWARVIAMMINRRSRNSGIATGDQGIFITRALFDEIKGFPDQPLMEDVELCVRLKKAGHAPTALKQKVTTSARRWQTHGVIKTVLLMWSLRWQYARGVSAEQLHQQYYGAKN